MGDFNNSGNIGAERDFNINVESRVTTRFAGINNEELTNERHSKRENYDTK